ncbi:M28 family peptidase [Sphingobacterium hungaricum]|uniref:Peptidase n=1 Tax=Sphingobacterium hungaricum TaxID=2082723 RepID=A0A928YRD2_9SPHI|nr:M28 family peptidase [Sphingobacterium hungaricum]MBE8713218.1 peptidase [Sphingobacterium hungaricum]
MQKIILFLFLFQSFVACSIAQQSEQTKYADLITEESSRKHLAILASDEFEGRGTGQKGGEKTVNYIAEQFKSYGLVAPVNGSYFQPVDLIKSLYVAEKFSIDKQNFVYGQDFYVQGDNNLSDFSADEIVFVGYGIQDAKYNDLANIDVKGKIVLLINQGEPMDAQGNYLISGTKQASEWTTNRFKRIQELSKLEPKLILATGSQVAELINRAKGRLISPRISLGKVEADRVAKSPIPVVNITETVANALLKNAKTTIEASQKQLSAEQKPVSKVVKAKFEARLGVKQEQLHDPNVLGLLEGSDLKDEIVIVSGHYDHDGITQDGTIYPGADDNGSGTVGVMELAKAFAQAKKDGNGPRRSILFLAFAAEEKGLLGSQFYSENPIFPLANTVTCLNLDMIGRIDDKHLSGNHNYIHVIGADKLSSELDQAVNQANDTYTKMELDTMYNDPKDPMRIYYRSDQYNFAKNGIPVIFFFSGLHPHYHTPEDTVDKIDFPMMVKREKLVFYTAWEVANRDKRLAVDSNKK